MADYQYSKEEQTKLNNAVEELVQSLIREDGEKQFRKDVAARIKEELGFKSSDLNDLAKERFENAATEKVEKMQNIVDLNELLLKNCK